MLKTGSAILFSSAFGKKETMTCGINNPKFIIWSVGIHDHRPIYEVSVLRPISFAWAISRPSMETKNATLKNHWWPWASSQQGRNSYPHRQLNTCTSKHCFFSSMAVVRKGRNKRNSHLHFFWKLFVAADACLCFEVRALNWFCLSCGFILQTSSIVFGGKLHFLFPSRVAFF